MATLRSLFAVILLGTATIPPVAAATYTAHDLYALPQDFSYFRDPLAPVAGGQVAGYLGAPYAAVATSGGLVILGPQGTYANGTNGAQQVGQMESPSAGGPFHAVLWNGTPGSLVDLHPLNLPILTSAALGTSGTQQVGSGATTFGINHAMLWSGSAASFVDLHPVQFGPVGSSWAYATDGTQQVGAVNFGGLLSGGPLHALLWSGTSESAVDLNPFSLPGFDGQSLAQGVKGGQQVGWGRFGGGSHALLWNGTPESAVDLHPAGPGFGQQSMALGTNGVNQVGWTVSPGPIPNFRAVVWSGSAASAIDLHALLPQQFQYSYAWSIDAAGNIFGTAVGDGNLTHAVMWTPVPEPATNVLLALAGLAIVIYQLRATRCSLNRFPQRSSVDGA